MIIVTRRKRTNVVAAHQDIGARARMSISARGIPGSPRLPPLESGSLLRAETHRPSKNAAVRGGGRLFDQSPLDGYSEAEMIVEAKIRLQHNKQRQQLKRLLRAAAEGGQLVDAGDLKLACQLAKIPLPATDEQLDGKVVAWKGFHDALDYPSLHKHGAFGTLPPTRREIEAQYSPRTYASVPLPTAMQSIAKGANRSATTSAEDQEVYRHWITLKNLKLHEKL